VAASTGHEVQLQQDQQEVESMLLPEIRCVVEINVAKSAHVICVLEVPGGAVRLE